MNHGALLFVRTVLAISLMFCVAGVLFAVILHPVNDAVDKLVVMVLGSLLNAFGVALAWFFGANASGAQAQQTIAKQSEMLAASSPPPQPPPPPPPP